MCTIICQQKRTVAAQIDVEQQLGARHVQHVAVLRAAIPRAQHAREVHVHEHLHRVQAQALAGSYDELRAGCGPCAPQLRGRVGEGKKCHLLNCLLIRIEEGGVA